MKYSEEMQATLKKVKSVASIFAENMQAKQLDEAFNNALELNTLLKSEELKDFTERQLEQEGILVVKANLKKYFYWNGEYRKALGAMVAKGKAIADTLN